MNEYCTVGNVHVFEVERGLVALGDGLYIPEYTTRRDIIDAVLPDATIDYALPEPWLDANRDYVNKRGGAFWYYGGRFRLMGRPLYWDTVMRLFRLRARTGGKWA